MTVFESKRSLNLIKIFLTVGTLKGKAAELGKGKTLCLILTVSKEKREKMVLHQDGQ